MAHHERHSRREIKERVLHTRVPEGLEIQLKRVADSLRVPVSNLVRAVLENALEAAEVAARTTSNGNNELAERLAWMRRLRSYEEDGDTEVGSDIESVSSGSDDGHRASRRHERKSALRDKMMRSVIGFQPLTLAKATRCAFCHREIAPEQPAYVTVRDRRGPRVIIGAECLPKNDRVKNREEEDT
jgi:hypothetical protein